jgi:Domain of unknown function DUF29
MNKHTPKHELATYDSDFHLWSQTQAALIRDGKFTEIDLENVAEEIESLGRSDRRAIRSRLEMLLTHLLKWEFQKDKRNSGWEASVKEARRGIKKLIADSPSLKGFPAQVLLEEYETAREIAAEETGFSEDDFPLECPYAIADVMAKNFLPGA